MPSAQSNIVQYSQLSLNINNINVDLSIVHRTAPGVPIFFLHGWGSSKEDYTDIQYFQDSTFQGRPFIAYDAPGCGRTLCSDLSLVNIEFQVTTADMVLKYFGIDKVHLVGHSMGGLAALHLAQRAGAAYEICSFTNIKGNLAPEDCFLSRQISDHPSNDSEDFLGSFIERVSKAPLYSSALYASVIRQRVQPDAIKGIFQSMVELSDHGELLKNFIGLKCARTYMYGEQYAGLSYLPHLKKAVGVEVAKIPHAGHFPMYSNPVAMWDAIGRCIRAGEA